MSYYFWLGREGERRERQWTYYGPCFPPEGLTFPPVDNKTRENFIARYHSTEPFIGFPRIPA